MAFVKCILKGAPWKAAFIVTIVIVIASMVQETKGSWSPKWPSWGFPFGPLLHNTRGWLTLTLSRPAKNPIPRQEASFSNYRETQEVVSHMMPEFHLGIQQCPSKRPDVLKDEERGWGQRVFWLPLTMLVYLSSGLTFSSLLEILQNMRKLLEKFRGEKLGTKNHLPASFPRCT